MRRTYRSKKGTSGALDHRDVLVNMDEKSSAFDAFYIQNIKQTKRELSCIGSSNHAITASNKVRKRKYVKRLVKEVEPGHQKERLSASAYLTPDKSIRVNKILDPFDMLLNTSSVHKEALKTKIVKKITPKMETKTYVRKRKVKAKNFNYSSTSNESDIENTIDSNITDIKAHDLLVERIPHKSPKKFDESIINIVSNLSLINSLKRRNANGSFNTSYKTRNRLTKNYQSPMMQKSPLCSTPCKEKYRGVSIFKFSPITQKERMSPTFEDDNNHSLIIVSKRPSQKSFKVSSLALISNSNDSNKNNMLIDNNKNSLSTTPTENKAQNEMEIIDNYKNSLVNNESSCQITEIEPFLGFSNNDNYDLTKEKIESEITCLGHPSKAHFNLTRNELATNNHDYNDSINVVIQNEYETNKSDTNNTIPNVDTDQKQSAVERSSISDSISNFNSDENESETEKSDCIDSSLKDDINKKESGIDNDDSLNLSSKINIDGGEIDYNSSYTSSDESKSITNTSVYSNKRNTSNSTIHSHSSDSESVYDTCDSDQSSVIADNEAKKEPIVVVERLNDSIFRKCYEQMLKSQEKDTSDRSSAEDKYLVKKEPIIVIEKINDSVFLKYSSKMYESQDGEKSDQSSGENKNGTEKKPIVAIEKINNSVFLKYNHKIHKFQEKSINYQITTKEEDKNRIKKELRVAVEKTNDSIFLKNNKKIFESRDERISEQTNDYIESLANYSNEEIINSSSSENYDTDDVKATIVITDSSTTDDVISTEECNNEEENNETDDRCVSFVTTRRRHEITNDSMFQFNHSYGSSSTDCDKTVLSNKVSVNKSVSINIESTLKSDLQEKYVNIKENYENVKTDSEQDKTVAIISTRKSRLLNKNNSPSPIELHYYNSENSSNVDILKINTRKSSKTSRQSNTSCSSIHKFRSSDNSSNKRVLRNSSRKSKISQSKNSLDNNRDISPLPANISCILKESVSHPERMSYAESEVKPSIVLHPGKKWERSLSIYKRMTMITDHFDQTMLEDDCKGSKGRKYRQSVISTMGMQEHRDSLHNDSINSRRSTFVSNPGRPIIRFVKDPNFSRVSLNTSSVFDDLKGFLSEECDDTVIELSKLSIADSEREVTILDNFHESERVTTARDYVLRRCNQTEPLLFDECYPETVLKNCHKIGEGVYGEVFLWRGRDGRARVMKIVPIAGNVKVNGEQQKDFHEIISEIVIAMELSALRAPIADIERQLDEGNDIHALELHAIENASDIFNEVLAVRCLYGPYPSRLLDLWELYDECKGSENDNPASLPVDQRYIVLELANAGQDLESYQFPSAQQAHALFQQIAFGLAVAEEAFQFEHRDLHWGNVLIAPTEQKFATFVLRGRTYRVPRRGVAATVIDYSLSRLTLPLAAECAALYNDLAADEQLFDAVGDYQFEVYRLMREKLGNDWKNFEPYTNILWLHYTVDKMITALRYKRTNTKIHKHYIEKLKGIKDSILEYGSAVQYVLTDIDF